MFYQVHDLDLNLAHDLDLAQELEYGNKINKPVLIEI